MPELAACAIGVFDGVHAGHQALIKAMTDDAKSRGIKPVAITFDIDPDELFRPHKVHKLLSNEERFAALEQLGVTVMAISFTAELAALTWQDFLDKVIASKIKPQSIFVGENFHFGAGATAGIEQLQQWAAQFGCAVMPQKLRIIDGDTVSSTRIRALLSQGNVRGAAKLLTRSFCITGTVSKGAGRGKGLGFATANIMQDPQTAQLGAGVYAGYCTIDGVRYKAAISAGVPPTFVAPDAAPNVVPDVAPDVAPNRHTQPAERSASHLQSQLIEAHLLDFNRDLYDKKITLEFIEFIRPMQLFSGQDELIATVTANINWTRNNLS